jgi:hypothetical protein
MTAYRPSAISPAMERFDDGALICVQMRIQTGAHGGASSIRTARSTTEWRAAQKPKYEAATTNTSRQSTCVESRFGLD